MATRLGRALRASTTYLAAALLMAAAAPQYLPAASPRAADPVLLRAQRTVAPRPRVLALYYGWFGTPDVSKQWVNYRAVEPAASRIGSQAHYPRQGPYDSTDPKVLERHVRTAAAAGVDTLVCSWWGKGDRTDRAFRALLPIAVRAGLTLCPMYERVPRPYDPASVQEEWRYLVAQYGRSPAFLKVDGRPVVFLYGRARGQLTTEQWADLLVRLERRSAPGVLVVADGADFSARLDEALVFDGLFIFFTAPWYEGKDDAGVGAAFQAGHGPALRRAKRFGRIPVVTVTPGMDASRAAPGGLVLDRGGGALYRAQWQEALKVPGAWVFINSFNDWANGTEVEPSVELGDRYVEITRRYALQARKAAPVPSSERATRNTSR